MARSNEAGALDGTWELIHGEQGGARLPEDRAWRARLVVADGAFTLQVGADALRGAFRPAPARGPGWVDAVVAEGRRRGAMALGIYEADGCRMKLCFAAPGEGRPRDFASGAVVYVWECITVIVRP